MNIDSFAENSMIKDPRKIAWVLFHSWVDDIDEKKAIAIALYDFLGQMGFSDAHNSFIVITALDWTYKEINDKRPAIINIIDQRILTFFRRYEDGFNAWDISSMKPATLDTMPDNPLISIAISVNKLHKEKVKPFFKAESV